MHTSIEDYLPSVNSIEDYLVSLAFILSGIALILIFRKAILQRLKDWAAKTETRIDDYLINGIERFGLPLSALLVVYTGLNYLTFSPRVERVISSATIVVVTFYLIKVIVSTVRSLLETHVGKQEHGVEKVKQLRGVLVVINLLIWSIGLIFVFDNLGYNVTAIITGLGIGGIAIALAAQNILGDLFNYFVIFFDRPFEIGDAIEFEDKKGTVEYIGIKTTRLKSTGGEQLIVPNSDLTKSRVHNFKVMERRRVMFSIGVEYQTNLEQVKEMPTILKDIITEQKGTTFDRAHLLNFAEYSLKYEVVYFIESGDFASYATIHQQINFRILEVFHDRGIQFAFPTQSVKDLKI